jgi:hypothetical protein
MSNITELEEVLRKNNYTIEQVNQWAAENYEKISSNTPLAIKLFLQLHGVTLAPPKLPTPPAPRVSLSEVFPGQSCQIEVVLVQEIESRSYLGCSKCWNKVCKCYDSPGEMRQLSWRSYLAGDSSGEEIITFCPDIQIPLEIGKFYVCEGSKKSDGEPFTVFRLYGENSNPPPQALTPPPPLPKPASTVLEPVAPSKPPVTVTKEKNQSSTTTETGVSKCQYCDRQFKSPLAIKAHIWQSHKDEARGVPKTEQHPPSQPKTVETTPSVKTVSIQAPQQQQFPDTAISLAKIKGLSKKPLDELKQTLASKGYKDIDIDGLLKVAGIEVGPDGRLFKKTS